MLSSLLLDNLKVKQIFIGKNLNTPNDLITYPILKTSPCCRQIVIKLTKKISGLTVCFFILGQLKAYS